MLRGRASGRPTATFYALLIIIVVLNLVGLVMVLSASSVASQDAHGHPWHFVMRQAVWVSIGIAVLLVVQRTDYHRLERLSGLGICVAFLMLVVVLIPGLGSGKNGATRWLGYGPIGIQPSEFAKLALLMFSAGLLGRRIHQMSDTRVTVRPVLLFGGAMAGLIMLQPNLGTTIVLGAIVITLLFVAGAHMGRILGLGVVGLVVVAALAWAAPYRRARLLAFLDPWEDSLGTGYQTIQAWAAISEGGVWGVGVGAGRAKWGFLPEAHTDFIFAVVGEEFGLVGATAVILLFVALVVLGVRAAGQAPDAVGTLLAAGATAWFGVQAFVNIGAVVGVLPITGVPLPFVSSGGSSLLAGMCAAGVLLNVARQGRPNSQPL